MIRRGTSWFLAAALAAALASSAAGEDSPAAKYYAMRSARVSKAAAARLWESANAARRESLFRFAREEARRVLDLDPDNAAARQFLGYVKKGDAWEFDLSQSGKLPTENVSAFGAQRLADAENAWRTVVRPKADLDVAAMYAQLGDDCAARSFRVESDAAYRTALSLDPENAAAREGVGDVRMWNAVWLTADAHRAFLAASAVTPVPERGRWDEILGAELTKGESGHFRVESPLGAEAVASFLAACESGFAAYAADLRVDAPSGLFPTKPVFCVVSTNEQWDRWVNRMSRQDPGSARGLGCHWPRDQWVCAVNSPEGTTDAKRRDRLTHQVAHMLNLALWSMPDGCWLDDALAYRCAVLVHGTTGAFCLTPKKDDLAPGGAHSAWTDASHWKTLLKEAVAAKDDVALRSVVTTRNSELPLRASVKAWSVADFLLRRDRAAFVAMLKSVKDERDLAALLETQFGKDVDALDEEWRRWVAETY